MSYHEYHSFMSKVTTITASLPHTTEKKALLVCKYLKTNISKLLLHLDHVPYKYKIYMPTYIPAVV